MSEFITFKQLQEITKQTSVKKVINECKKLGLKCIASNNVVISSNTALNHALEVIEQKNQDDYTV